MAVVGDLVVNLSTDARKFDSGLSRAKITLTSFGASLASAGVAVAKFGAAVAAAGVVAGGGAASWALSLAMDAQTLIVQM